MTPAAVQSVAMPWRGESTPMGCRQLQEALSAPILDEATAVGQTVDPVPQALVLTAIVIGVAVNALLLALVIRLYRKKGTLNVEEFRELRW